MAWTLATGAAVTLSWWGVHTVMSGTAYDPPHALPIAGIAQDGTPPQEAEPQSASTRRPKPGGSGKDDKGDSDKPSSGSSGKSTPPKSGGSSAGSTPTGNVKSYTVAGGRVAFDIGNSSAELVSATPNSGWTMQVWKPPQLTDGIRVTFTQGSREISVFCTWHDHRPLVEIDER